MALLLACSSAGPEKKGKGEKRGLGARLVFSVEVPPDTKISREKALDQALRTVRERVQHLSLKDPAVYKKDGGIVVEFVEADDDQVEMAKRAVGARAALRFRLVVHGHDGMRALCRTVEREGDARPGSVNAVRDAWMNEQTGKMAADCYLLAPSRAELEQYVDVHRADLALGTTQEVVYEEQPPLPDRPSPGWRTYVINRTSVLTGAHVANANMMWNPQSNAPEVQLEFDDEGRRLFALITEHNIGKKLLMSLDGRVLSAPLIRDKVTGGISIISLGRADPQQAQREAQDLVAAIRSGSLPAPLRLESATSF